MTIKTSNDPATVVINEGCSESKMQKTLASCRSLNFQIKQCEAIFPTGTLFNCITSWSLQCQWHNSSSDTMCTNSGQEKKEVTKTPSDVPCRAKYSNSQESDDFERRCSVRWAVKRSKQGQNKSKVTWSSQPRPPRQPGRGETLPCLNPLVIIVHISSHLMVIFTSHGMRVMSEWADIYLCADWGEAAPRMLSHLSGFRARWWK